jgi:hypothetical protein
MTDLRLLDLPGVAESTLPEGLLARLPATTPAPPWDCRVRAVVWLQRGRVPLPAGSPFASSALSLVVGAFVEYLDSPVGGYSEVFAGPLLKRRGLPTLHIPFIAVDSLPSVHGGRAHWSLPKAHAAFEGDVGRGVVSVSGSVSGSIDGSADGGGWSVRADAAPRGLPVPLAAVFAGDQGGGPAKVTLRGRGRLTRVRVTASGPTLSGWLGTGTHLGVVGSGRMVVHPVRKA